MWSLSGVLHFFEALPLFLNKRLKANWLFVFRYICIFTPQLAPSGPNIKTKDGAQHFSAFFPSSGSLVCVIYSQQVLDGVRQHL